MTVLFDLSPAMNFYLDQQELSNKERIISIEAPSYRSTDPFLSRNYNKYNNKYKY